MANVVENGPSPTVNSQTQSKVPPGGTTIQSLPVVGYTTPTAVAVAAGATSIGTPLVYLRDGFLTGLLANDLGGLPGVRVTALSRAGGATRTAQTGVDGRFSIQLPVGSYDISVDAVAQHVKAAPKQDALVGSESVVDVLFTYRRYGELHGFVTNDAGQPLAGVSVHAALAGGPSFTVQTNLLGAWSIRGPPTDAVGQTYRVFVLPTARYELPVDRTATLAAAGEPGGTADLGTFVLTRFAQLTGRVTDDAGGLGGVVVHARRGATVGDTTNTVST